ncbi:MAG: DNA polymerase III subunit beta [Candidatus Komeilibacteria bacterium]|jgi:DNA polymerase III subunit beta|nr:DNA polymerase III subunit beta [Candidatus Komeilibacteria bacterium]MBT4447434.1 DNA polymerase III subunit beta [Candidatus Komeilibacteria bacterium]
MKIVCTQENLNKGLSLVSNIANKSSNLPILNNVLLKADKEGLTLITTDLELGIKVSVRGKIEEEGEFTVDAKLLHSFVSFLPRENINMVLKEDNFEIKSSNQETSIKGLASEDFPLIPDMDKTNVVELPVQEFKKSLSQTLLAASLDTSRIEINAVNFSFQDNNLTLAATDSYRLAEKKLDLTNTQKTDLIIPLKTLQELSRILNEQQEKTLKIYFNENQILFEFDGVELTSRVIDGKYPDYNQIIPDEFKTEAKCDINKLVPAVKSVALFCKSGINDIRLSLDSKNQKIIIATASSNTGTSVSKVDAKISGEDNDIVFNYRYLLDGLAQLGTTQVNIKINNNSSPGLVQPLGDDKYIYLVMPIRQ